VPLTTTALACPHLIVGSSVSAACNTDRVIPINDRELSSEIPGGIEFWLPDEADLDDMVDGNFGGFIGNWLIVGESDYGTQLAIDDERRLLTRLGQLADTAEDFDRLAHAVEDYGPNDSSRGDDYDTVISLIDGCTFNDCEMLLDGLEIGVAGLTLALSAAGMHTVASCRGHEPGIKVVSPWSTFPLVAFTAEREQISRLQPLVRDVGAGFDLCQGFGAPFLALTASTTLVLNDLAQRIEDSEWPEP